MIYKYTKCESVIAKIMADADMKEKDPRVTDMREWIFEAIEKIGAPVLYILRESGDDIPVYKVEDYQVPIPNDLEQLTAVAYSKEPNGPWIPVRSNEQTFKTMFNRRRHHPHYEPEQPMKYKIPTTLSQLFENNGPRFTTTRHGYPRQDVMYSIKPGWIVLNVPCGFVKLSYKAIATDERGYPLIPDTASYQEAVYWYVMMKLNFPGFLKGTLGGHRKYNQQTYVYIQSQWNFYRNQAYAEAMMPTESEMRSIKNEWTKLIPDWDSDDVFFKSSGERQLNYNDYYYGY